MSLLTLMHTNNTQLLEKSSYTGLQQKRVRGKEYDDFLQEVLPTHTHTHTHMIYVSIRRCNNSECGAKSVTVTSRRCSLRTHTHIDTHTYMHTHTHTHTIYISIRGGKKSACGAMSIVISCRRGSMQRERERERERDARARTHT